VDSAFFESDFGSTVPETHVEIIKITYEKAS